MSADRDRSCDLRALRSLMAELRRLVPSESAVTSQSAAVAAALEEAEALCRRLCDGSAAHDDRLSEIERTLTALTHELTNAMTVVVGVADRLQHEPRIARGHREKLHLVAEQGRRASSLIRQIAALRPTLRDGSGEEAAPPPADAAANMAGVAGGSVLLVEDQDAVRLVVAWQLEGLGFQVHAVGDAEEALAALRQPSGAIDLVILDWVLPGADGTATLERIRALQPAVPIIVLTAHPLDTVATDTLRNFRGVQWLSKPASVDQLRTSIQAVQQPGRAHPQPSPAS